MRCDKAVANYAFIDGQNLYAGVRELGWKLDNQRMIDYLARKYRITKCYYFVGYLDRHESLYEHLRMCGYELRFKPVTTDAAGNPKGNVDADLVLQAMIDLQSYDRAIIVSGDGDYYSLVGFLRQQNKLLAVLSPNRRFCSSLLRREAQGQIWFVEDIRHLVERG